MARRYRKERTATKQTKKPGTEPSQRAQPLSIVGFERTSAVLLLQRGLTITATPNSLERDLLRSEYITSGVSSSASARKMLSTLLLERRSPRNMSDTQLIFETCKFSSLDDVGRQRAWGTRRVED